MIDDIPLPFKQSSLSANSDEEVVTRDYIASGEAELVCILADSSQLERSLFMLADYAGINTPAMLVLTMTDVAEGKGRKVDVKTLENKLGIPVVGIVAPELKECDKLKKAFENALKNPEYLNSDSLFEMYKNNELYNEAFSIVPENGVEHYSAEWLAAKLMDGDKVVADMLDDKKAAYAFIEKAKNGSLIRHYITLPTIICFIGGLIGSAIGFSDIGIVWQMTDSYSYFSIPDIPPSYPLYLIIYAVVMPPVISVIVNYIVISKRLSKTALSLIRNEQKISHRSKINLGNMCFIRRFQIRQMLREARTGVTVVSGMFICLLIFMLGMNCYVLCQNIKTENAADTKFTYMYNLKYPEETAPENAEACYMEALSITDMGYTLDVNIIGIDSDNRYYSAKPQKGKNSIVAASSTAQKYGL